MAELSSYERWSGRLRREPLVLFVLLATPLYFIVPRSDNARHIVLPAGAPDGPSLQAQVQEEILRREAVRLGLDRTQEVRTATAAAMRSYLAQQPQPPSTADLEALHRAAPSRYPAPVWVSVALRIEGDAGTEATRQSSFEGLLEHLSEQHGAAVGEAAANLGTSESRRVPTAHGDMRVQLLVRRPARIDEAPALRLALERTFHAAAAARTVDHFVRGAAAKYTVEVPAGGRSSRRPATELLQGLGAP